MPELHTIEFAAKFDCLCGAEIVVEADVAETVRCNMCKRSYQINVNITKMWANLIKDK